MADPNIAPEGKIWVCMSCMRTARNKLDFDETCLATAVLCDEVQPAPGFYAVSVPPGQAPGDTQ